jgi:hypothetical protein
MSVGKDTAQTSRKMTFERHGAAPGPIDQGLSTYYLVIIGDHKPSPLSFNELDVAYLVGQSILIL